jgi:hypothetical protein
VCVHVCVCRRTCTRVRVCTHHTHPTHPTHPHTPTHTCTCAHTTHALTYTHTYIPSRPAVAHGKRRQALISSALCFALLCLASSSAQHSVFSAPPHSNTLLCSALCFPQRIALLSTLFDMLHTAVCSALLCSLILIVIICNK